MYAAAFGLAQEPFSIAPDPRFLFMSERHREALAHLLYGVRGGGGFVLLTGEVGAGKTTVCRCFLEQIPKRCNVAYVFNPKLSSLELLQAVCDEFHLTVTARSGGAATVKDHVDTLNRFLLDTHAVGHSSVLIIDEAQNLTADVLEQLRLLTNLETSERKLLQIVLIGQPELRAMLARPELEQVAQRVIARYHLQALTADETVQYVRHRLAVAGARRGKLFDRAALARLHLRARGVPRRINLLADRALLGAYAEGRSRVDLDTVERAAAEVFGSERRDTVRSRWRTAALAGGSALTGAALLGASLWAWGPDRRSPVPRAALPAPAAASAAAAPGSGAVAALAAPAASGASAAAAEAAAPWPLLVDEALALRTIVPAWGLAVSDGDACLAAVRARLRCFRGKGDLALMRQLARPVVVSLRGDDARPMFAAVTAWQGDRVILRAGAQVRSVPLAELAARWGGEFATFWRVPPGYGNGVLDLRAGPATEWLAQQLARVPGASALDATRPREAALREQVRAFQAAQGLPVDGLAGPITLMQLNRVAGIDESRFERGG
jgi:general secretion pathway protein A